MGFPEIFSLNLTVEGVLANSTPVWFTTPSRFRLGTKASVGIFAASLRSENVSDQ